MEYYGLRKAGADVDLVISCQDHKRLVEKYPDHVKDLYGDIGVWNVSFGRVIYLTWIVKKGIYRMKQKVMKLMISLLKFPQPELLTGVGSLESLPGTVKSRGINNVLIVTGQRHVALGLLDGLCKGLEKNNIRYVIYDGVQPNPTIQNIEDARNLYLLHNCDGVIAFGGGSPMDCAKVAVARVTNSRLSIKDMRGYLKIKHPLPTLFAVPTTSGTGSEVTIAAVVTDPSTHEKFAIGDLKLVPKVAVLDPRLTVGLPPHITAATGMDALTHAVEAYIGKGGTKFTDENAEKAVRIIFDNLEPAYQDGGNIEARNQLALASYFAGLAFTRAYVGYVHAIAHGLGGLYGVPHGLANAVVLPYVLEYYGSHIEKRLAKLAVIAGLGTQEESKKGLCHKFIDRIKTMNKNMDIPGTIKELQEADIPLIAKRAIKESNPDYPVPKIMDAEDCMGILQKLLKVE